MPRVDLLGGAYQALSVIANAQRCVNLYQEANPRGDSPVPLTHYTTPGLDLLISGPMVATVRCTYRASNGQPYVVIGSSVYYVNVGWTLTFLGSISNLTTPVIMADNGLVVVIVDGTLKGWAIDLATNSFGPITDPSFLGATRVDYLDTFLVFNQPGTANLYISLSEANFEMFTGVVGAIYGGQIASGGSGYQDGSYSNIPLINGSGTGFTANFTITGGIVTVVTSVNQGENYVVGDSLEVAVLSGIATANVVSGGSSYVNGTYFNVPLTGGSGTGARATVVVAGNVVTTVTPTIAGVGYLVTDIVSALTVDIGGSGTGFSAEVASVSGTGFVYSVENIHGAAFDPLDIAAKNGYPDPLVSVIVMHREIWLIGQLTCEIWYDAGAADFAFQAMPGAFIEHGCVAPYSVAAQDLSVFWLSQDKQGQAIVIEGSSYQAHRVSTHAIENEIRGYANIADAIGFCYQEEGHVFYVLAFPSADVTWVYDKAVGLWHQRAWTDSQGVLHRHRANCAMNAYGTIVCGDWQNGNLYNWDLDTYTDIGQPISRIRSMPHLLESLNRIFYTNLIADMQVGTDDGFEDGYDSVANPPTVGLRFSDDRGVTYGSLLKQSTGTLGQYKTSVQFRRLGMARDRVFELSWSFPAKTALNSVFITTLPCAT